MQDLGHLPNLIEIEQEKIHKAVDFTYSATNSHILQSPETVQQLFQNLNDNIDVEATLHTLINIASTQQIHEPINSFDFVFYFLNKPSEEDLLIQNLTIEFIAEVLSAKQLEYVSFFSQPHFIEIAWQFVPSTYTIRLFSALFKQSERVYQFISESGKLDQIINSLQLDSPDLDNGLEFLGCILDANPKNPGNLDCIIPHIINILVNTQDFNDESTILDICTKLIRWNPAFTEYFFDTLPLLIKQDIDQLDLYEILCFYTKVANASQRFDFILHPNIYPYIISGLTSTEPENQLILGEIVNFISCCNDVTPFDNHIDLINAIYSLIISDQQFRVREIAYKFICQIIILGNVSTIQLIFQDDDFLNSLLNFIQSTTDIDTTIYSLKALLIIKHISTSQNLQLYSTVMENPDLIGIIDELCASNDPEVAKFANAICE